LALIASSRTAFGGGDRERDQEERQQLARTSPAAMSHVEAAEAAAKAGRFTQADELVARARDDAPTAVYPTRVGCRIAIKGKNRELALKLCQIALLQSAGYLEDVRNRIVAGVSADFETTPDMSELVTVAIMTKAGLDRERDGAWANSGRLELGRRLGDRSAVEFSLAQMQRFAPDDAVTKESHEAAFTRAPIWIWALRLLFLGLIIVTVSHVLVRRRNGLRGVSATTVPSAPLAGALVVALSVLAIAPRALAADPQRGPERLRFFFNEDDPDSTVPSPDDQIQDPLQFGYYLQDALEAAQKAAKDGDHARAARDYGAIAKAVPQRALAWSKQCEQLELAGDLQGALTACSAACTRDGVTLADYKHTVKLLLSHPGPLTADDHTKLNAIIEHLSTVKEAPAAVDQVRCEVALRETDIPALQRCTDSLGKLAPKDPQTISFQWALAVSKQDRSGARLLVERAKKLGMAPAAVAKMEDATDAMGALSRGTKAMLGALVAVLAIGVILVRRVTTARRLAA
jgi:hypothetical protein